MKKKNEVIGTYEAIEAIRRCIASLNPVGNRVRVEMPLVAVRDGDGEICARIVGDVTFSFDLICDASDENEEARPILFSAPLEE